VAHEINNPLTAVLGHTQLLLERADLPAELRERIGVVAIETERAARIVQNLLLFARSYPPERRPCSLADQVRRVLDLVAYQLKQQGIRLVTEVEPSGSVWADANQLQQVLLNLVQNAVQAMTGHPGARVLTVRVRAEGPLAVVEVCDSGPGIPPDVLPRIFDPFFTTKPPGQGSGLGLSVSCGIAAEHGGRLRAENRPEGGACLTLELPRAGDA
jgi:two-component system NtrC family sensor kinase